MSKLNKKEIAANVADKLNTSKVETLNMLEAFVDEIKEQIADGYEVDIYNFIKFAVVTQKAKTGKVPGTDKVYSTPEKSVVKATLSKSFKNSVN